MSQKFDYKEELSKCRTMQDSTGQDGLVEREKCYKTVVKNRDEIVIGEIIVAL